MLDIKMIFKKKSHTYCSRMYNITGVFSRQGTDHTGEITVLEAVSSTLETLVSFARRKKLEKFFGMVGYIHDDFPRSGHRPLAVDGCRRGQLAANDPAGSFDDSLQPIPLSLSRVAVPHTHREKVRTLSTTEL